VGSLLVDDQHYLVSIQGSIAADVYGGTQLDIALEHYRNRLTPGELVAILSVDTGGLILLEIEEWRDPWED